MPRPTELLPPVQLEAEVLRFWREHDIFAASLAARAEAPRFVFYEGPPTANGMPHNGHVLTRVIKDLFPRYRTMRGYRVDRKAGWDTHGLPVEVEVEKELGIHGKAAIEAYGIEPFSRKCIESVFTYTREWEEMTERVGFWLNFDDAYVTYHRSYVESVWWALSELFKKGLLYQDYKVVWWWAQGGTALSAGEVGEGYKTVEDPSATIRFPVVGQPGTSFLAWTTTPWTLPSNVALAVNAKFDYAYVRHGDEILILAEALREAVVPEGEVIRVVKGSALVGMEYEPLYTFALPEGGRSFVVVAGEHVELGATGIVHTAPAFGEDDFALRRTEGLGFLQLVGPDGKFIAGTGFLEGRFCKDADQDILRELKSRGRVFRHDQIRHEYPFCPRAPSDPLIQYARPAWFIRTTAFKEAALANNAAVAWSPETIRDGRFGDFLRNNVDWALSRERYWGTPLPIWVCDACGQMHAPGGVAEIEARGGTFDPSVSRDLQVHKPWIDRVTYGCEVCPGTMRRVPEVIDCWFDAGCMPFAQWGFPHQGVEAFKSAFPADFISEAVDQTRGWFYSLLMISTLLFDDPMSARFGLAPAGYPRPYRNCIVLGHVCDAKGEKESKSKGNYTSPDVVLTGTMKVKVLADPAIPRGSVGFKPPQVKSLGCGPEEKLSAPDGSQYSVVEASVKGKDTVAFHPEDAARLGAITLLSVPFPAPGADAFRWLFYASSPPWSNTRISLKAILDGQREFLFRLRNVHQFYVLNAEGHVPAAPTGNHALDAWILADLHNLVRDCTSWLDSYAVYEPARAIQGFVEGLSNWWLRRSRDRFDGPQSAAKDTLYFALATLSRLIAPFVPFTAEGIHRSFANPELPASVHLCDWPIPDPAHDRPDLAADMALVREIASLGLSARANVGVRVRQPLAAVEIVLADARRAYRLAPFLDLVKDELNVREVHLASDAERFVTFKVKPDYKVLGARLGKDMKACAAAVGAMEGAEVRRRVLGGGLTVELPSGPVTLGPAEIVVAVEPKPGFQAAGSAAAVVALHSTLDEDLLEEGLAREIIAKVQALRKQLGVAYGEVLGLAFSGGPRVERVQSKHGAAILAATSARSGSEGPVIEIDVDGEHVVLRVGLASLAELPTQVVDILSVHGPVKLTTGSPPRTVTAHLAPLHRALLVLVPSASPAVRDVLLDGRAEIMAAAPAGDYLIRVRGNCAPGRRVAGEPRRPEIVHWLPENANANGWLALHLFPTWVEFTQNKAGDRTRAMGPIPGVKEPAFHQTWWNLAFRRLWFLLPVAVGGPWLWALFFHEASNARWFAAVFSVPAGVLLLASVGLFDEWARFTRWREGVGDKVEGGLAEGLEGADRVRLGAGILLGMGLFQAMFAGGVFGWDLALVAIVCSTLPVLGPYYGVRHLLRQADANEGTTP